MNDYIYRPEELSDISMYEFVTHYHVKKTTNKKYGKNDNDMESDTLQEKLYFQDLHPVSKYTYVIKLHDKIKIPMIKYHKDFPDLPKLQLDQGIYVTSGIQKERDLYGKLALM